MDTIDIHTHIIFQGSDPSREAAARMIEFAQSCGIGRMVVLGDVAAYGRNPDPKQIRTINDQTLALMRWFPQTLIGFCYLNPRHGEEFNREETGRCVLAGGCKGIKLWTALNGGDRRVDHVYEIAEALDLPILQHAWETIVIKSRDWQTNPFDVAVVARRFPRVQIIMAHLTAGSVCGVLAVRDCPNVSIDTSGSQPFRGVIEYAVDKIGSNRVVFGSDVRVRDFPSQLGRVLGAEINAADRENILYRNAERLLKLEPVS